MSSDPLSSSPPLAKSPEAKLVRNIHEISIRIMRGKAAAHNGSVYWQQILGIASIIFSALGSAGIIVDKVAGNLPDQTGVTFWSSLILLLFGILSQIANQFRVAQRAADSESLAVRCGLYETRLTDMLMEEDPQTVVADLFVEVTKLFQSERYNVVLPVETGPMRQDAKKWADELVARHREFWQLKVKMQRHLPRETMPATGEDPGNES
jgi:hypothetical protein